MILYEARIADETHTFCSSKDSMIREKKFATEGQFVSAMLNFTFYS